MSRFNVSRFAFATLALAAATPAFAHDGPHDDLGFIGQLAHLLTEPDHLAFIIIGAAAVMAFGIKIGLGKPRSSRLMERLRALRKAI